MPRVSVTVAVSVMFPLPVNGKCVNVADVESALYSLPSTLSFTLAMLAPYFADPVIAALAPACFCTYAAICDALGTVLDQTRETLMVAVGAASSGSVTVNEVDNVPYSVPD